MAENASTNEASRPALQQRRTLALDLAARYGVAAYGPDTTPPEVLEEAAALLSPLARRLGGVVTVRVVAPE